MEEKIYEVPINWNFYGTVKVRANGADEAFAKVMDNLKDMSASAFVDMYDNGNDKALLKKGILGIEMHDDGETTLSGEVEGPLEEDVEMDEEGQER